MRILAQEPIIQDTASIAVITTAQYPNHAYTKLNTSFTNDIFGTLENNPSTQIQRNSPGGLVTALSNGMGARHFTIIWDDVNIQSPINGTYDLNLIPAFLFNESLLISQTINPGYGNASMAGGIFLKKDDIDHISISHLVSNTENQTFAIRAKEEIANLTFELGHQRNNYNHKYPFFRSREKRVQQDAQYNSSDWIANVNVDLPYNWEATIKTWIQDVVRDISPSKTTLYNGEYQEDQNQRYSLNLLGTLGSSLLKLKYAHFNEQLNFFSNVVDSRANNRVHNYSATIQNIPILRLNFGVQIRKDAVDTNFGIVEERHNVGLNASKQYQVWNNISAQFQVRKDWVDKKSMPLTYRIGFDYQAKNALSFHIDLSKNYNLPTFNDLYWPFGGNELLLNEESYQYNISAYYSFKQANSKQGVKVGLQYQDVENWILWRPENGIWTPNNQKEVDHYGLNIEYTAKRYLTHALSLGIDYSGSISSTISLDSGSPSTDKGNQLIFVPQQKHALQVTVGNDESNLAINNIWVGKRFITTDNLNSLPAYYITDITYKTQFSSSPSIHAWITIHNLFNHNYEVIPFFPTPLRHLSFGVKYHFI